MIEAVETVAGMVKSSGLGPRGFQAITENLHIQIRQALGQHALDQYHTAIRNKAHYKRNGLILLPTLKH